jgi:hypothetical protein
MFKFTDRADFIFIVEWLAHNNININDCDDIDSLYDECLEFLKRFEVSPHYLQSTSYLQAVKDYLNSTK